MLMKWGCAIAATILLSACAAPKKNTVPCTILQQASHCVTVPMHSDAHEDEAKLLMPPPAGFNYLYITRPYSQQRSVKSQIFLNDALVAELGPQSFARLKARPGSYVIKVVSVGVEDVKISAEVGNDFFLEYQITEHLLSAEADIKSVSQARAKDSIQRLNMVASWEE
jgi:hypothetical protein